MAQYSSELHLSFPLEAFRQVLRFMYRYDGANFSSINQNNATATEFISDHTIQLLLKNAGSKPTRAGFLRRLL